VLLDGDHGRGRRRSRGGNRLRGRRDATGGIPRVRRAQVHHDGSRPVRLQRGIARIRRAQVATAGSPTTGIRRLSDRRRRRHGKRTHACGEADGSETTDPGLHCEAPLDSGLRRPESLTVERELAASGPPSPRGSDHDLSKPSERLRARVNPNAPTTSSDQGGVNATRTSRGFGPGIARAPAQQGRTVVVAARACSELECAEQELVVGSRCSCVETNGHRGGVDARPSPRGIRDCSGRLLRVPLRPSLPARPAGPQLVGSERLERRSGRTRNQAKAQAGHVCRPSGRTRTLGARCQRLSGVAWP
jgi:hypothetical protein